MHVQETENFFNTADGQKAMLHQATSRLTQAVMTFMEIQAGPNPLTHDEIRKLMERHPDRYNWMIGWLPKEEA